MQIHRSKSGRYRAWYRRRNKTLWLELTRINCGTLNDITSRMWEAEPNGFDKQYPEWVFKLTDDTDKNKP